jgi:hypothetical protein
MAVDISFEGGRIQITFSGAIIAADLTDCMKAVVDLESRVTPTPDRLIDLGPSSTVAIGFGDVANVAHLRKTLAPANPIRTAVVAHTAAQQGYARMFQTLNDHPLVTVAVFADRAAAGAWLDQG